MSYSKKLFIVLAGAAIAALCLAPVAMAAVQRSNHDMTLARLAAPQKAGACSYCHIPHRAAGSKLWPSAPATGMTLTWANEPISLLCWSCHGAGSSFATAQQVMPFQNEAHQSLMTTLNSWGDATGTPALIANNMSTLANRIKCTTCHNVHDNTNRPFLRYVTSGAGTFDFDGYCRVCHYGRVNAGQTTANSSAGFSNHPTGTAYSDSGVGGAGRNPVLAINAIFAQSPGTANNPSEAGYNLGGHLQTGSATVSATNRMNCATCHLVHGNETANYAAADGVTARGTTIAQFNYVLAMAPAPTTTSAVCQACHSTTVQAGPGNATTYSHPINTLANAWSVTVDTVGTAGPTGSQWGTSGGQAVIVCQSCHNMHYGQAATSILTGTVDPPIATSNSNCAWCHSGTQTAVNHHPTGAVVAGTDYVTGATARTAADTWATRTRGAAGLAYNFPGNNMVCGTCHGGNAHNNAATFPGLWGYNTTSEMCVDCHSYNPSTYTSVVKLVNASSPQSSTVTEPATHFVGTIATANYRRTAAWSSGASSKYVTTTAIICESCHTLKFSPSNVTPRKSANGNSNGTNLRPAVGLLVEVSGNSNSLYDTTAAATWPKTGTVDMCTGCHGSSGVSAQGSTHPVLSNMTANVSASVQAKINAFAATVSMTSNTRINCESCHRPHDAAAGSGALILESCDTNSTKTVWQRVVDTAGYTNEAIFCNQCHNY